MTVAELLDMWWMRLGVVPLLALLFSVGARLMVIRTGISFRWLEPEAWLVSPDLAVLSFMTLVTGLVDNSRELESLTKRLPEDGTANSPETKRIAEQILHLQNDQTALALLFGATAIVAILGLLWVRAHGYDPPPVRARKPWRPEIRWWRGVVGPNVASFVLFVGCLAATRIG